jgi:hypothetical protein
MAQEAKPLAPELTTAGMSPAQLAVTVAADFPSCVRLCSYLMRVSEIEADQLPGQCGDFSAGTATTSRVT